MSWSITVNGLQDVDGIDVETQEYLASQHAAYPRDMAMALALAKSLGLASATLSGGRTPNPYGGDELVDVSVRGTPIYRDFLLEMREIIANGPSEDTPVARHYAALAVLRTRPCSHVFTPLDDGRKQCLACRVFLAGTLFSFEDV